ncbi:hypothetical protein Syun_006895 [Stephania yunnanensis]|uniref:Uncharacterized protein n=1 Tax=Stephania yunnanensis TaxID=152371 RepID=A0AAP0PZS2_9MAGN
MEELQIRGSRQSPLSPGSSQYLQLATNNNDKLQGNPDAMKFRHEPLMFANEMELLFGGETFVGLHSNEVDVEFSNTIGATEVNSSIQNISADKSIKKNDYDDAMNEGNPDAMKFRHEPLMFANEMELLFGGTSATGKVAWVPEGSIPYDMLFHMICH